MEWHVKTEPLIKAYNLLNLILILNKWLHFACKYMVENLFGRILSTAWNAACFAHCVSRWRGRALLARRPNNVWPNLFKLQTSLGNYLICLALIALVSRIFGRKWKVSSHVTCNCKLLGMTILRHRWSSYFFTWYLIWYCILSNYTFTSHTIEYHSALSDRLSCRFSCGKECIQSSRRIEFKLW